MCVFAVFRLSIWKARNFETVLFFRNGVNFSMEAFVRRFQRDRYDRWLIGQDFGRHPLSSEHGALSAAPPPSLKELTCVKKWVVFVSFWFCGGPLMNFNVDFLWDSVLVVSNFFHVPLFLKLFNDCERWKIDCLGFFFFAALRKRVWTESSNCLAATSNRASWNFVFLRRCLWEEIGNGRKFELCFRLCWICGFCDCMDSFFFCAGSVRSGTRGMLGKAKVGRSEDFEVEGKLKFLISFLFGSFFFISCWCNLLFLDLLNFLLFRLFFHSFFRLRFLDKWSEGFGWYAKDRWGFKECGAYSYLIWNFQSFEFCCLLRKGGNGVHWMVRKIDQW